jgi:tetratricopeptide (TPR) repeat protein
MSADPADILAALQQARAAIRNGNQPVAAAAFAHAESLAPDNLALLAEYAGFAERCKQWERAARLLQRIGQLKPDADFEGKLGYCLFRLARYAEAIPLLTTALSRAPADAGLALTLALSLLKELRWEEALALAGPLMARERHEVVVELVINCLYNLGRNAELDALLNDALRDFPDNPLILALCGFHLLKSGDYARGFDFLPAIRRRYEAGKPDMKQPPLAGWDGRRFDGMLLLNGEQGLGEEILCASMFTELEKLGQPATISCDPRLIALFSRSFPSLHFVSRYDGSLARIEAGGIRSYRFNALDLACLYRRAPYQQAQPWLRADRERVAELAARYRLRAPGKRLIGLSWRTGREVASAPRSIRLIELEPLLRLPDTQWFNVQYGDYSRDIGEAAACNIPVPWDDLSIDQTQDIDGLAAQLCAFDALVSISNTTVHLAGALGVTSHLMLPKSRPVMWYWGYAGERSPWYPSVTIHRNAREDGWRELPASLAAELGKSAVIR